MNDRYPGEEVPDLEWGSEDGEGGSRTSECWFEV